MGDDVGPLIGGVLGLAVAAVVLVIWLAMRAQKRRASRRGDEGLVGAVTPARTEARTAADNYVRLAGLIVAARATGQYEAAMLLAKRAWPGIPSALRGELAGVELQEIPAIDAVLDLLVAADDEPGLAEMRRTVKASERLAGLRRHAVDAAADDLACARRIFEAVARQPGIVQKDLDELLGVEPEAVRERCYWMAQLGRLERKKKGSSYALFPSLRHPTVTIGDDGLPIVRRICPGCRGAISEQRASCRACGYDIRKIWWIDHEDEGDEAAADYAVAIVGESHRQEALEDLCGGRDTESAHLTVTARLVREDDNPHDEQAVQVIVQGRHVGYLSRADARRYRALPTAPAEVPALIVGGWDRGDRDVGHYGVRLALRLDADEESPQ